MSLALCIQTRIVAHASILCNVIIHPDKLDAHLLSYAVYLSSPPSLERVLHGTVSSAPHRTSPWTQNSSDSDSTGGARCIINKAGELTRERHLVHNSTMLYGYGTDNC